MTKKLYYSSPLLTNWSTNVKEVIQKDQYCLVTLVETAFYPEGGGQPADGGKIQGIEVLDVFKENGEIYHKLPHPPLSSLVNCELDWDRRYDHMQQHTGQHLLSAVCIDLFDAHTSSFHLGKEVVSIDLSISELTPEQLEQIEFVVNQYIYDNHEIKTYFVTKDELNSVPLRKIPEVEENEIRIVQIGNHIDTSACAGTHVTLLGELGLLKILKTEKSKGNTRVYFLTGKRAFTDYQQTHQVVTSLATRYSTNREGLIEKISKMENENKQLQKEIELLKAENNKYLAAQLIQDHQGLIIDMSYNDKTLKELQGIAAQITEKSDKAVLLTSTSENKLLFAHNGSLSIHSGQFFKEELPKFNGKGGGKNTSAQGGFQNINELNSFKDYLLEKLKLNSVV